MPSRVTGITAAGRNLTIDYNAGEACDVIKVLTCIKIAWDRVRTEVTKSQRNRRRQRRLLIFQKNFTFQAWKIYAK